MIEFYTLTNGERTVNKSDKRLPRGGFVNLVWNLHELV